MPNNHTPAIGQLIVEMASSHRGKISKELRKHNLYPGQELLLMSLSEHTGCSQKDLREILHVNHTTITKSISRLENTGLVIREQSPTDRRMTTVSLTDEGEKLIQSIRNIWLEVEQKTMKGLTLEEAEQFQAVSKKIIENLKDG